MPVPLRMRVLCSVVLLGGIMLVAGCSVDPPKSPPAPISSSQSTGVGEAPPPMAAPSNRRAAVRSPLHHPVVAALKSKRHLAAAKRHRARIRTVKRPVQQAQDKATEPESAANTGVVHHVGSKIVPLD